MAHADGWQYVDLVTLTFVRYDTIVYLTCSKKLTGSQLSLPHGINKKLKCEAKTKMMSTIGPYPCFDSVHLFQVNPKLFVSFFMPYDYNKKYVCRPTIILPLEVTVQYLCMINFFPLLML